VKAAQAPIHLRDRLLSAAGWGFFAAFAVSTLGALLIVVYDITHHTIVQVVEATISDALGLIAAAMLIPCGIFFMYAFTRSPSIARRKSLTIAAWTGSAWAALTILSTGAEAWAFLRLRYLAGSVASHWATVSFVDIASSVVLALAFAAAGVAFQRADHARQTPFLGNTWLGTAAILVGGAAFCDIGTQIVTVSLIASSTTSTLLLMSDCFYLAVAALGAIGLFGALVLRTRDRLLAITLWVALPAQALVAASGFTKVHENALRGLSAAGGWIQAAGGVVVMMALICVTVGITLAGWGRQSAKQAS
jgi:hypothetical protein